MLYEDHLKTTISDLAKLGERTWELNDHNINLYAWIVDSTGSPDGSIQLGWAWIGAACGGKGNLPRPDSGTSVTAGPTWGEIIGTAGVICCNLLTVIVI